MSSDSRKGMEDIANGLFFSNMGESLETWKLKAKNTAVASL